jgi:hypothetical protein
MKKYYYFLLFVSILGSFSCKKSQNAIPNPKVDIYISGTMNGRAVYWKNDTLVYLTDGTLPAAANSIIVSGNDVYVAGREGGQAAYWKNGTKNQVVTDGGSNQGRSTGATSIAILGNDVYLGGYQANPTIGNSGRVYIGRIWKNGIRFDSLTYSPAVFVNSLFVSGNDLYVAGSGLGVAKYWKNGIEQDLVDGTSSASIVASGDGVFVAGQQFNNQLPDVNGRPPVIAKYWKNGNPVNLTDGSTGAGTTSIAVSGSDVYVAGVQFDGVIIDGTANGTAKYWKNGNPVHLTDGSTDVVANSIAVSGIDVYVAGTENGASSIAKYWINGKLKNLNDGTTNAVATAIFIAGR